MKRPPLSLVFLGTSTFAVPSLEALADDSAFSVNLVITQPDKPKGREKIQTQSLVKLAAQKRGLLVAQPEHINEEFDDLIAQFSIFNFQFSIVVAYGQILSQTILDFPDVAPVNVHASLLPRWRGASPMQHAILAGDREAGITIQKMIYELDAGPILAQERTPIEPRETFTALHDRLATMGAKLLVRTLKEPLHPKEQSTAGITICKKLTRVDGVVDPNAMTAEEIDRRVRALNPWPGVTMTIKGTTLKILETRLEQIGESYSLGCAHGTTLYLVTVQPPGKKPMSGAAWGRGRR
ncbi:methionyl-tRNA formyltransferase [Candidatus Peregrinibacteria bacterium]|nr:methionyl-tRNA formyltransferase [Candidatus Peregrinibacteria bacterium]MBI3816256.1 methionyl-tRNA formyltransferase [Candidatus Peregrinibacteria bacterium]